MYHRLARITGTIKLVKMCVKLHMTTSDNLTLSQQLIKQATGAWT